MFKCTNKNFTQSTPSCFFKSKNKKQSFKQKEDDQVDNIQLLQVIQKLQLVLFSLKEQSQKVIKFSKQEILIKQQKIKQLQEQLQQALNKNKCLQSSIYNQEDTKIIITNQNFNQKNKQFSNLSTNIDSNKKSNILQARSILFNCQQSDVITQRSGVITQRSDVITQQNNTITQQSNEITQKFDENILNKERQQNIEIKVLKALKGQTYTQKRQRQKKLVIQCSNDQSKFSILQLKQNQDEWLCLQSKNSHFGVQQQDSVMNRQYSQIQKLKEPLYLKGNQNKNKENNQHQNQQIHKISGVVKLYKSKLQNLFSPLPAHLINKKIQIPKNQKNIYLNRYSGSLMNRYSGSLMNRYCGFQDLKIYQAKDNQEQKANCLNKSFGKKNIKIQNIMKQKIMNKQTQ